MQTPSQTQPTLATFPSHDGALLHYRHWPAAIPSTPATPTKRAILLFHRGHEHSGRWQETVEALYMKDVDVFAWDARGHGASPGERGSAEHIGVLIRDVNSFVQHVSQKHGIEVEEMVVVAHSVGAVVVAAWVHDFAPKIRGLVLATPAFSVKLYVPLAIPALRLRQRFIGPGYVKSYVKSKMLMHDPEQARKYTEDPAIFPQIAVNLLLDLHDTGVRLVADAGAIRVPVLMLSAGSDYVVKNSVQRAFFERLSSPDKEMYLLPGFHHAIFHEKDRKIVTDHVRAFADRLFSEPRAIPSSLLNADRGGYTKTEYDGLLAAPDAISSKLMRAGFASLGRLSDGIALGLKSGFDSGETLDYVYENRARGTTALGRMMDQAYIESPGWSGIRMRRKHLEEMLRSAMRELHAAGRPVHILDAACGGGRYVLDTLNSMRDIPSSAILRDYKQQNLDVAEKRRAQFGLNQVTIVQGNAFDRSSFSNITPRPTIGIVSGLLELFPGNEEAQLCLGGFADAIEPGGILIYTGQPWHPQLKFIAGVLRNREGNPWIMRRRTQEEMDELVSAAGFKKETQVVDPWGIFTVSMARRVSAA